MLNAEPAQLVKNSRGEAATTRTVQTGAEMLMTKNMGIQGDPKKDDIAVAIGTSTPNRKPRAAPRQPDVAELTQAGDGAAQSGSAVPGASAEQPGSSGPISSEADNTPAPDPHPLKLQPTLKRAIRLKLLSSLRQITLYPHLSLSKMLRLSVCLAPPHRRIQLRPSKLPTQLPRKL